MNIYKKALKFKILTWLQVIAGAMIILSIVPFIIGMISKGQFSFSIGIVVFLIGCGFIFIAVLLAIGIKCEVCKKKSAMFFRRAKAKYTFKAKNEIEALLNDFYPIEIREGKFRCVHCGTEIETVEDQQTGAREPYAGASSPGPVTCGVGQTLLATI